MNKTLALKKKKNLLAHLKAFDSLLVAFSGGVDSTFLLAMAYEALDDKVLAATADSPTFPEIELEESKKITKKLGIKHIIFKSNEFKDPDFLSNHQDRCYVCKKHLSQELIRIAKKYNINYIAHAANRDDLGDYRPGLNAAKEMGLIAPLVDMDIYKEEVRFLSREMGLSTWDKPAMACLSSRIPYGSAITEKKLQMIEQAEASLAEKGFRQYRVRHHGDVARIEVEQSEFERAIQPAIRDSLVKEFRTIGFLYIALDLEGFESGKMNRVLE